MKIKKIFFILTAALIILSAFSCKGKTEQKPEDALANVEGVYITQKDLDAKIAAADPVFKKFLATDFGKSSMLSILVKENIMRHAALKSGVKEDAKYIKIIDDLKKQQEEHLKQVEEDSIIDVWLENLRTNGTISVTEKEIADYNKRYPYEITMRVMTIAKADDANAILRELKASSNKEKRFEELAKRYAVDPGGALSGGNVITFIPGEYITEIENAAANSPSNSVQGFFKTSRGFTIIYKKKEERISLAKAKDRITIIIENKKFDEYLAGLAEQSKVEVYKTYENE
ncbi:parvulin-like peptidyl-prolyl isomerase [Elusimicrobium posterum]|uniref:peptidylprolyl isomerase n=1 Tax=Elusimicrobium posterum TaxID=3116653 RepID=UPI003C77CAD8